VSRSPHPAESQELSKSVEEGKEIGSHTRSEADTAAVRLSETVNYTNFKPDV